MLPQKSTSDHSMVNVKVDVKLKAFSDVEFYRRIYGYTKVD